MVYIAEFSVVGTMELADEILICAESEEDAQLFARHYASNWGIDLHSLRVATDRYIRVTENCHYWVPKQLKKKQGSVQMLPSFAS